MKLVKPTKVISTRMHQSVPHQFLLSQAKAEIRTRRARVLGEADPAVLEEAS